MKGVHEYCTEPLLKTNWAECWFWLNSSKQVCLFTLFFSGTTFSKQRSTSQPARTVKLECLSKRQKNQKNNKMTYPWGQQTRSSLLKVVTTGHRKCWNTFIILRSAHLFYKADNDVQQCAFFFLLEPIGTISTYILIFVHTCHLRALVRQPEMEG